MPLRVDCVAVNPKNHNQKVDNIVITMAEIPLVYPSHVAQPRRYVVDGHTQRLRREEVALADDDASRKDSLPILEDALPGSASVSEILLGSQNYLLTTCAIMESPDILNVTLSASSSTVSDWGSPRALELDYSRLELQPIVKIEAFSDSIGIQLTLVDCQGTFVTIFLTRQLTPADAACRVLKMTDYIAELAVLQQVTGSELQATMIAFASATTLIMGLSPFLMTVDLDSASSYCWSETQCLEDMRARQSSFTSLLTNVSDLVLGKLNEQVMDMSPTSALCLSTASNALLDSSYCITLHSDGSIRQWKIDMNASPLPLEVRSLDNSKLPAPSSWSDARNAICLCARTYDTTFAIGVHIKTEGFVTATDVPFKEDGALKQPSDCHLYVLYGNTQQVMELSTASCVTLSVPDDAVSLVGMSFSPTDSRCSLSVLFDSWNAEHGFPATLHLVYPPSIMSIVSSEPVEIGEASLDRVASEEQARIRSLLLGPSLLDSMPESTVEELLHEMDTWYLKYLFRPMFPRGTGTVTPPSTGCIHRAFAKLVHGSSIQKEVGMSLELEVIRTIYEWRQRDIRKLVTSMNPKRQRASTRTNDSPSIIPDETGAATPFSVYDALAQAENFDEDEMEVEGNNVDEWEKVEKERSAELEAHEKRWRRFLLQVWDEERANRTPLLVKWLNSRPLQAIVRSDVTTVLDATAVQDRQDISSKWKGRLDSLALQIMDSIDNNRRQSSRLYAVEQQVSIEIAKAQLALRPLGQDFMEDLTVLARTALMESQDLSDAEHGSLNATLGRLGPSQIIEWIQETPRDLTGRLPVLRVAEEGGTRSGSETTWSQSNVANYQLRHSACALSIRCVDSVRRFQLGRALLLLDMGGGNEARDAALRAYLHTIAVLWTSSQRIAMPLTTLQSRRPISLDEPASNGGSPPIKRLSFGDDLTSILAPSTATMTTPFDAIAIDCSQTPDAQTLLTPSPIGVVAFLTQSIIRQTFSGRSKILVGKPSLLPELGALPRPRDETIATDHPRLALRLLAPFVAYALPDDAANVVLMRKESLAECLLIESHTVVASGQLQLQMRQIACELLVPKNPSQDTLSDRNSIRVAFEALNTLKKSSSGIASSVETLAATLTSMVPSGSSIEIIRLCELETMKSLFTPIALGAGQALDENTKIAICRMAEIMLHLSRVMYRLTILERHVTRRDASAEADKPDVLIGFFSSAIDDMARTFPEEVCEVLPEYSKMWTRLFNHSVLAGQWKTAYSACVKNPKPDYRENNLHRLVRAMVDQGALKELLQLCTELRQCVSGTATSIASCDTIDLYEIASEILAEAATKDIYSVRAASREPTSLSDYLGSLYALHSSQRHWRRAAQSMDLRFANAQKALGIRGGDYQLDLQSNETREGIIVDDLVLAAVGALNAIELVTDDAHKFIVSGEYGTNCKIPVGGVSDESSGNASTFKRSRADFDQSGGPKSLKSRDRLSNFMSTNDLFRRAIRYISLRALYFDRMFDTSVVVSSFTRPVAASKPDIDALFSFGYFQYGLLLAKAWAGSYKAVAGSGCPGGSDLFFDSLQHLLETYLLPTALRTENEEKPRPTLMQVYHGLDAVANGDSASMVVAARSCRVAEVPKRVLAAATMSLVRKLTLIHTSSITPVALEVASICLDIGHSLPAWLEQLLLGTHIGAPNGLFAPRPSKGGRIYLGDPAALLKLYTKNGMYAEACNVVTSTLSSLDKDGRTREERAASRLPEKGDIDFVPYKSIDLLWNLIEVVSAREVLKEKEKAKMMEARYQMERSLEKHFELMKINAAGMRSARTLRK